MNDLPTLRYEDHRGLRVFATTDDPDQYIFKVGKLTNLVTQTGPHCTPQQLYTAVLEGIEEAKAQLRRERPHLFEDNFFGQFATVVAWRGEMKGETLRRLEAAEGGLAGLDRWVREQSYEDVLASSFWLQAEGPDHMTRVRALSKLADIYGITAREPIRDGNGGVVLIEAT
ncbi:hypothetical protein P8S55_15710 [Halomonas sp. M1]|uniref:hypothetical protein n=1 Tax=Halomonas sp. M1 TaxID=3035470 RepID=UPI0024866DAB|nr:hypothetical protein [Halomonas sp. M1]WFE71215.1 hypothetical protein P8S55_15710 [Halomonas sp. M1]